MTSDLANALLSPALAGGGKAAAAHDAAGRPARTTVRHDHGHDHDHSHDHGVGGYGDHDRAPAAPAVVRSIRIAPSIIRMGLASRLVAAATISAVLIAVTAWVG